MSRLLCCSLAFKSLLQYLFLELEVNYAAHHRRHLPSYIELYEVTPFLWAILPRCSNCLLQLRVFNDLGEALDSQILASSLIIKVFQMASHDEQRGDMANVVDCKQQMSLVCFRDVACPSSTHDAMMQTSVVK